MTDDSSSHDNRLHFGCGLLFGGIITFLLLIISVSVMETMDWAFVAAGALVCGFLAARQGERFWGRASSIISAAFQWLRH